MGVNGRPLRKVTQNKIDYSLMIGRDKDERECRTSRQKAQEEEEIEEWVKAMVDMQQKRSVMLSLSLLTPHRLLHPTHPNEMFVVNVRCLQSIVCFLDTWHQSFSLFQVKT